MSVTVKYDNPQLPENDYVLATLYKWLAKAKT